MKSLPKTVVFWGAGATASIGIRTTAQQAQSIRALGVSESDEKNSLQARVKKALDRNADVRWVKAFTDLLTILGDEQGNDTSPVAATQDHIDAMRRHWPGRADEHTLRQRIGFLRTLYDWPALKAAIAVCPGKDSEETFLIQDLFNILDMHGQSGHGFRVDKSEFLTPQRVLGARSALEMLLLSFFYVDWQKLVQDDNLKNKLRLYYQFAEILARNMQKKGCELDGIKPFDSRDFYLGNISIASLNYDPIMLWVQYIVNRDLNNSIDVPYVGQPARRLQLYHDMGQFIAGKRISREGDSRTPWHPMNESSAQRLNDEDHGSSERIRISKYLFPHGCVCWRECPDCGKLSSYMGDEWELASPTLIPPPPLMGFLAGMKFRTQEGLECEAWDRGEVDARACVHCGTLTFAHHTQTVMQTNFKKAFPPVIEEIQRDMRVVVQNAEHIVLMGYSLPSDDVVYRSFFAARQQRDRENPVRCTVVDFDSCYPVNHCWLGPSEWPVRMESREKSETPRRTLEAAGDIFRKNACPFLWRRRSECVSGR